MKLTHVSKNGKADMVDIGFKEIVQREAVAKGAIYFRPETINLIKQNNLIKGDVLAAARLAAIQGAKKTSELIPLCHNILIDYVGVDFELKENSVLITSRVRCLGKTGAEMEALMAVSIAALTIYDMCKAVDKTMTIGEISLEEKSKHAL